MPDALRDLMDAYESDDEDSDDEESDDEDDSDRRRLQSAADFSKYKEWVNWQDKMPKVRKAGWCKASWAMAANAMLEIRTAIKYDIPAEIHMSD